MSNAIHTPASFLELVENGTFIEICNAFNHVYAVRLMLLKELDVIADGLSVDGRTMDGMTKAAAANKARAAIAKASPSRKPIPTSAPTA